MLNTSLEELYNSVDQNKEYYDLNNEDLRSLKGKHLVMIDEHKFNSKLADNIRKVSQPTFGYEVWETDHSFTNKRIALTNKLLEFLDR
jgi:lipid A disaccharide synthetase